MFRLFLNCFRYKYFQFSGRAARKEYWSFQLFYWPILIGLFALTASFERSGLKNLSDILTIFSIVFFLFSIPPSLSVTVRRLHDQNLSGWWWLLNAVPILNYVTSFAFLVFFCRKGDEGKNRFGDDPLASCKDGK